MIFCLNTLIDFSNPCYSCDAICAEGIKEDEPSVVEEV